MAQRSLLFVTPAEAGGVDVEITHVEARRLIREYELPNRREDGAESHPVGSWEKEGGAYRVHIHA